MSDLLILPEYGTGRMVYCDGCMVYEVDDEEIECDEGGREVMLGEIDECCCGSGVILTPTVPD